MATKMKVLLIKNVANLGTAGEIKEVSGGYGRNYLLPQELAVVANRGAIKQAEERLASQRKREAEMRVEAQGLAQRISGVTLSFAERVGENDRLFGSVTASDIAEQIASKLNVEIDRRRLILDEPIKSLGTFHVTYHVMSGIDAVVTVHVTPLGE